MAMAIDRGKVSTIGEYGYEPPANQAGIVTPTFSDWLDQSLASKYDYSYNPAKAKPILTAAGFKKGSDGIMANAHGQKLSFHVINIGGYSDWVASVQVIQQNLKAVGIQLTPDNLTNTGFTAALYNGKFELAYYEQQSFGPGPYYELRNWLVLAQHRADRPDRDQQLRAVQQPGTDALIQQYAGDHLRHRAALDRQQAAAGHADRGAGHPGHRGGRLVPVQHRATSPAGRRRATRTPSRPPTPTRTWSRCCCT